MAKTETKPSVSIDYDEAMQNVHEAESNDSKWRSNARTWEKCYDLEAFDMTYDDARKAGLEMVIDPSPINVIDLALRQFPDMPAINVPAAGIEADLEANARIRQAFLIALWQRSSREMGLNVPHAGLFHGLVHGKFAFNVGWQRDNLPKRQRDRRSPILIQPLNPFEVGQLRSQGLTKCVFRRYTEAAYHVQRQYPAWTGGTDKAYSWSRTSSRGKGGKGSLDTSGVDIVDYWWVDEDGYVCNVVYGDSEPIVKAHTTDYIDIPIVISGADWSPSRNARHQWRGILAGKVDLWKYKCRLLSLQAQGVAYYHDPAILVTNSLGQVVEDLRIAPGETEYLPTGTEVNSFNQVPNTQLSEQLLAKIEGMEQQTTFPSVSYGEAPGSVQTGYGVSILADGAGRRVNALRQNMQWAMEAVNEIALGMVEEMAESKGVSVWGRNEATGEIDTTTIRPSHIKGAYANDVDFGETQPGSSMQAENLAMRWLQEGIVSPDTLRPRLRVLGKPLPEDEDKRVLVSRLMADPQNPHAIAYGIAAMAEKLGDPDYAEKMGAMLNDFQAALQPPPPPQPPMPPMPPPMPEQMQGPPMQGPPMEPSLSAPLDGMSGPGLPPVLDPGAMSPEMLGMNRNDPAAMQQFQQAAGNMPSQGAPTVEEMAAMEAMAKARRG